VSAEARVHACQGVGDGACVIAVNVPAEQKRT
jgi:hypothetical protein